MKRVIPTSPLSSPSKRFLISNNGDSINTFCFTKIIVTNICSPKIVEICMLAVHASELKNTDKCARIIDKLVMTFSSDEPIQAHTSELAELTNGSTAHNTSFCKNSALLVRAFLSRQHQPICLLSHQGFQIDFPILKGEMSRFDQPIDLMNGHPMYCADSINVFKFLDERIADNSILDSGLYTLESLCHRYNVESQQDNCYTAFGACKSLLGIVKNVALQFVQALSYRKISTITAKVPANVELVTEILVLDDVSDDIAPETYVYMDLETTGLGTEAKITEICLVAVGKHDLTKIRNGQHKHETLPRVRDIVSLCVNTDTIIAPRAVEITGISNANLNACHKQTYNYGVNKILELFLSHQKQPVCMLTYNGNKFDYPIFRKHYRSSKQNDNKIMDKILCGDVMECLNDFYNFHGKLGEAYKMLSNGSVASNLHQAEDDVNVLINITMLSSPILKWINEHCLKLMT